MTKRLNPFGDASPLQFKSHIGPKEVNMGVNRDENMQLVYEKTKDLLFEGSKKAGSTPNSPCKQPTESMESSQVMPQVLPGQLRLDSTGHLCARQVPQGGESNGHSNGATAALDSRQDETMDTEVSANPSAENGEQHVRGCLLPGQLLIDPEGHLCSGIKVQAINRRGASPTLGFRICQSCNRPSNVGARPCHFCDKQTCSTCLRHCSNCSGLFCQVCSILNYDENFERSFCLQCCDM